jgi:hypothetical protein
VPCVFSHFAYALPLQPTLLIPIRSYEMPGSGPFPSDFIVWPLLAFAEGLEPPQLAASLNRHRAGIPSSPAGRPYLRKD